MGQAVENAWRLIYQTLRYFVKPLVCHKTRMSCDKCSTDLGSVHRSTSRHFAIVTAYSLEPRKFLFLFELANLF
jgi:hypothetical protein